MRVINFLIGLFMLAVVASPASAEVYDWSQTPSTNDTADTGSDVQWAEGMTPSDVNDSARAMMAEVRKWIDDLGAFATSTTMQTSAGTSTAYTLATEGSADNLENGRQVCFLVDETNGASATLNVDSLGAKPIYGIEDTALPAGALPIDTIQCLSYDAAANSASGAWMKREFVPISTSLEYDSVSGAIKRSALTGDISCSAGSNSCTIPSDTVDFTQMANVTSDRLIGRDTASSGDAEELTLSGGLEFSGAGSVRIADAGVTAAKLASDVHTMPVGTVFDFAGTSCPTKSVAAYGQELDDTTYSALLAVIGTTYGAGGVSTFNAPDLRGRVAVGEDDMGGVSANRVTDAHADSLNGDTLGDTGGTETETLSEAELAAHTHTGPSHTHTGPSHTHDLSELLDSTSSNGSHSHDDGSFCCDNDAQADPGTARNVSPTNGTTGTDGSHTHTVDLTWASTDAAGTGATGASGTGASGSTGSGTAFAKVQPSIVLMKCIYAGV
jgi:microcystin-dependent protein